MCDDHILGVGGVGIPTGDHRLIDTERLTQAKDTTDLCAVLYEEVGRIRDKYRDLAANGYTFDNIRFELEQLRKSVVTYLETHGTKIRVFRCVGADLAPIPFMESVPGMVMDAIDAAIRLQEIAVYTYPVSVDRFVYAYLKTIGDEQK